MIKNFRSLQLERSSLKTMLPGLLILSLISTPVAGPRKLKPGFNLFSKAQDVQLGKEAASEVEKKMQVVKNSDLEGFISRIGKKLASQPQADPESYAYSFKVVNEKSINAFALPGGPAFVHTGLISAADNEAQIAGVLAHEIAHVALRHGTNQASKANLIQLPAMLAGAAGGGSMLGQLAQIGVGLGANSMLLKFSRNAERDADLLGTRIMAAAGYNPIEMARFFEKLESQGGSRSNLEQFLSDHPNPGNRVKAVQEEIKSLPRRSYESDPGQLQKMKQIIAGLPAPPSSQPVRVGSKTPDIELSGKYKRYEGKGMSLSYPDTWEVFQDKSSTEVTIAPRSGILQTDAGGVAVGFGMILNVYVPENEQANLERDTDRLINQLQQSNPGMKITDKSRKESMAHETAMVTTLSSQSPFQGETEVDRLVTFARPQGLFYAVLISAQSRWKQMEPVFQEISRSIQFPQ